MGNLVKKFLRASMCNVFVFTLHMGILYGKDKLCKHDYALKAEDTQREEGILMQLLASAACHYANTQKTKIFHAAPQVSYNIQQLTVENISNINEMEFIETFKGTDDQITSAIANKLSDENSSLAEQTRFLLPKLLEGITEDFPHLVVCMQPTDSCREDIRFDPQYVVHQLRAFKLMETIMIRQKGYARRLSFSEFLNRYKYLAFDFDEEVELNKQNCQLLLIRLKMDGWKMGLNKVFLKYYAEEYLSRLYETHVKKIVKVQAMARRFIVKARHGRHV